MELATGPDMTWGKLLEARTLVAQRLHFGGEPDTAVATPTPEQRHHADRISGGHDLARLLVGEHEGEHAVEVVDKVGAAFLVEVDDHLAVGPGGEPVFPRQPLFQLFVVVDLAVDRQRHVPVLVEKRLRATLRIDDGQSLVREHVDHVAVVVSHVPLQMDTAPVGPRCRMSFARVTTRARISSGSSALPRTARMPHIGLLRRKGKFAGGYRTEEWAARKGWRLWGYGAMGLWGYGLRGYSSDAFRHSLIARLQRSRS